MGLQRAFASGEEKRAQAQQQDADFKLHGKPVQAVELDAQRMVFGRAVDRAHLQPQVRQARADPYCEMRVNTSIRMTANAAGLTSAASARARARRAAR